MTSRKNTPKSATESLLDTLKSKDAFLCTVESCTGGLLVNELTDVSGSSEVIWGGFVTYDNSAKQDVLGIPADVLLAHGAVSRDVAAAMAEAGVRLMKAACHDKTLNRKSPPGLYLCVSLTGIAGPTGGTPQKPVGLCYIGISSSPAEGPARTEVHEIRTPGPHDRIRNKRAFADEALKLLRNLLGKTPR